MEFESDFGFVAEGDEDLELPPRYRVVLLNDDFTTKEFVVEILVSVFRKQEAEAVAIMESVHRSGRGGAGVYSQDIAETRAQMAMGRARERGFPFRCVLERE